MEQEEKQKKLDQSQKWFMGAYRVGLALWIIGLLIILLSPISYIWYPFLTGLKVSLTGAGIFLSSYVFFKAILAVQNKFNEQYK